MAKEVHMPKLGMTMETGTIIQWFKSEGDTVEAGEVLLEVMTDKINIEVEAYESGTLLKTYYQAEDVVPVNQVIGYIGEPNEQVPDQPPKVSNADETDDSDDETVSEIKDSKEKPKTSKIDKPRATPAARKLARKHGVSLQDVPGSGSRGRIHIEDVQKFVDALAQKPKLKEKDRTPLVHAQERTEQNRTTVTEMRKVIGQRMVQSVQQAPHVTLHAEIDMGQAVDLRNQLLPVIEKKTGYRVSYTEIIIKAVANTLQDHPNLNASMQANEIVMHEDINIGLAVDHPKGLLVPVIPHVNQLTMSALTEMSKRLAKDAREGMLTPDTLHGGTFTVSNLGMYAVDNFTPIINLPETAILGVGRIGEKPVGVNGEIVLRPMMAVSLSFDHRTVDGAPAAAFLTQLKETLEDPFQLLV